MKIARILGLGLVALILIAGVGIVALFLLVDPNDYKSEITRVVKESHQRTLKIDGDLKLTLFPRLGLDLGQVSLSEYQSEANFARIQHAHVAVALLPLLQKRLLIDRIELDGLAATLRRDAEGHTNLDDLLKPADEVPPKQDNSKPAAAGKVSFDIAGFELRNGSLTLQDAQTKTEASLGNVQIKTGRIAEHEAVPVQIRADVEVRNEAALKTTQARTKATLTAQTTLQFDREKKEYRLAYLDMQVDGEAYGIKGLKLSLNADKLASSPGQLRADNLKLRAAGQYGADPFEIKFDLPGLSLTQEAANSDTLSGSVRLGGAHNLDLQFTGSAISGTAQNFSLEQLAVNGSVREGTQAVQIKITTPLKGELDSHRFDLSAVTADLVLSGATHSTLHLNGKVQVDLNEQSVQSVWQGRVDTSKLEAKLQVTRFKEPALRFDLDIDQINLDRYKGNAAEDAGQSSNNAFGSDVNVPATNSPVTAPEKTTNNKPINLGFLKAFSGQTRLDGNVQIASLQVQNIKAQGVRLTLTAADEKLHVAPLSANLYQGSLNGALSADVANRFSIQQTLTGVTINPLMRDAMNRDVLEGRGDVTLDLSTAGSSVDALKRGLNGSARLVLRDGAVKGFNLAKSLRDFKAKIGMKSNETQRADGSEKTDFSELSASFNLDQGVASNDDLTMKSPFLRVGGAGQIDLGRERIDYLAKATVVNTSSGQDGKDLAQLTDLTLPVRLGGSFAQPTYSIEWSGIASKALENKLKEKLGEKLFGKPDDKIENKAENKNSQDQPKDQLRDQLKDKLQDKLKGLLGR